MDNRVVLSGRLTSLLKSSRTLVLMLLPWPKFLGPRPSWVCLLTLQGKREKPGRGGRFSAEEVATFGWITLLPRHLEEDRDRRKSFSKGPLSRHS